MKLIYPPEVPAATDVEEKGISPGIAAEENRRTDLIHD
jgi:hypothetical protein